MRRAGQERALEQAYTSTAFGLPRTSREGARARYAKTWMSATPRALTPVVSPNPRRRRRKSAQNLGCLLKATLFGGISPFSWR